MSVDEGLVFDEHIVEEAKCNLIVKHLSLAGLFLLCKLDVNWGLF